MADPSTLAAALNYYGNSRLKRSEFDGGEPPTIEGLGDQWQGVSDAIQAGPDNARKWLEKEPGYTYGSIVPFKQDAGGNASLAIMDMVRNPLIGALDLMQMKMARDESGKPVGLTDPGLEAMATAMVPWGGGGINKGYLRSGGGPVGRAVDNSLDALNRRSADVAAGVKPQPAIGSPGIRAYHGSPHDFDKFDASKIGTGEGAQAYGHGMYFAENEGVARSYRDSLTPSSRQDLVVRLPGQKPIRGDAIDDIGLDATKFLGVGKQNAGQFPHNTAYYAKKAADSAAAGLPGATARNEAVKARIDEWANAKIGYEPNPGKMYEVNIKSDPDHFLDWDKPLSEQSQKVLQAFGVNKPAGVAASQHFGYSLDEFGALPNEKQTDLIARTPKSKPLGSVTGSAHYEGMARDLGGREKAAAALKQAGIPGIKYLDQGSRAGGVGSSNYVVFDPATIEILRKYGLLGMIGGGAAAAGAQPDAGQTYD